MHRAKSHFRTNFWRCSSSPYGARVRLPIGWSHENVAQILELVMGTALAVGSGVVGSCNFVDDRLLDVWDRNRLRIRKMVCHCRQHIARTEILVLERGLGANLEGANRRNIYRMRIIGSIDRLVVLVRIEQTASQGHAAGLLCSCTYPAPRW